MEPPILSSGLPPEVWYHVFRSSDAKSAARCSRVCRELLLPTRDDRLWKTFCQTDLGHLPEGADARLFYYSHCKKIQVMQNRTPALRRIDLVSKEPVDHSNVSVVGNSLLFQGVYPQDVTSSTSSITWSREGSLKPLDVPAEAIKAVCDERLAFFVPRDRCVKIWDEKLDTVAPITYSTPQPSEMLLIRERLLVLCEDRNVYLFALGQAKPLWTIKNVYRMASSSKDHFVVWQEDGFHVHDLTSGREVNWVPFREYIHGIDSDCNKIVFSNAYIVGRPLTRSSVKYKVASYYACKSGIDGL